MDFETARFNMLESQIRCCKILDPKVLDLLSTTQREHFLPESVRSLTYMEGRVPLPCGQEMFSPVQEGHILQSLQLTGQERILEIGSGSGYFTALLALLGKEVVSYELHPELSKLAEKNLKKQGIDNATVITGNALTAIQSKQKFDVIVIGSALESIPESIQQHLHEQGKIISFIGKEPAISMVLSQGTFETHIIETLIQEMEEVHVERSFVF
ncbi:MAG: protein-L-isoaspartate O-methyltransferase [Mariprofundaceae bacterium]|nr:protein-L-isoaspartate O-methyltransferase [Mariprofundaceae bacterium]